MRQAILGLLFLSGAAYAANPCFAIRPDARDYLQAHPEWRIVTPRDLAEDDRNIWMRYLPKQCPGMTIVDFDGTGDSFVVLGLLRRHDASTEAMTIALRGTEVHILRGVHHAGSPTVLHREKPGSAKEWDSEKRVALPHQSVSIVQIEASSEQFYLTDGRFRSVWTSD
jgi:hypothetical protein